MEKIHLSLLLLMFALFAGACKEEPYYRVTGEFPGAPDGTRMVLCLGGFNASADCRDTAEIQNGRVVFTGQVEIPVYSQLYECDGTNRPKSQRLWVENAEILVSCPWDSLAFNNAQVSGSATQDLAKAFQEKLAPLQQEANKLVAELWDINSYAKQGIFKPEYTEAGMKAAKKQSEIEEQIFREKKAFIASHPASPVSSDMLSDLLMYSKGKMTLDEVDALYHAMDMVLKSQPSWEDVRKAWLEYRSTAKGEFYKNFAVVDKEGNTHSVSDFFQPGKYNLLECWASWCGPCRQEIPHLKRLHDLYGDRLNIVGISADADPLAWEKAMAEDQPNYPQVRMVKDEHGKEMVDYYGTVVLPYTLLLDGEGKIVSIGARGAVLDFVLSELLENE